MVTPLNPTELLKEDPNIDTGDETPVDKHPAPVIFVVRELLTTKGEKLEILTRSNTSMAHAVQLQGIWSRIRNNNGSDDRLSYVSDRVEQTKRMAVSMNGRARDELISAIDKGGNLPAEYYTNGVNTSRLPFSFTREDEA